jgi:transposase
MFYDKLITNSNNKTRTTWNIVKSITGKRTGYKSVQPIYIDDVCSETDNNQVIADTFQHHFLSTADKIILNINNKIDTQNNRCIEYLFKAFKNPFPSLTLDYTTSKEIKKPLYPLNQRILVAMMKSLLKFSK